MRIEPYLLDDRVIIPDSINNMSKEKIECEIALSMLHIAGW